MQIPDGDLYTVDLPYAYFAIIVKRDTVVFSPPIGSWMIGKPLSQIKGFVGRKGGQVSATSIDAKGGQREEDTSG